MTAPDIQQAYASCRSIAKREAKNFYYAFRVLPRHKSDAMCAVYAFMRQADDLADDESLSLPARREAMAQWIAAWRASRSQSTTDPIFIALNHTQQRFGISDELLEQLVAGTTMDLAEALQGVATVRITTITETRATRGEWEVYETFNDLYRYCYLVASVVGLVCIRIFGYTDPRAETFAEHTGIAFQLTNILRDIKEDAERGRVYLPLAELSDAGLEVEHVVAGDPTPALITYVNTLIARADEYYKAADKLIPLLDPDARPAMSVLAAIYRRLLERIASDPAAVFRRRISVPTREKLTILAGGALQSIKARMSA